MSNIAVYAAGAAVLASLIAGFISIINVISSREAKVSEFRLTWIDGLRNELAEFISLTHELIRIETTAREVENNEHLEQEEKRDIILKLTELSIEPAKVARENLWKIRLRLNPWHIRKYPDGLEARLTDYLNEATTSFNNGQYQDVIAPFAKIGEIAPDLLKREWEKVKKGEPTYRNLSMSGLVIVFFGIIVATITSLLAVIFIRSEAPQKETTLHLEQRNGLALQTGIPSFPCPPSSATPGNINIDVNVNDRQTYKTPKRAIENRDDGCNQKKIVEK